MLTEHRNYILKPGVVYPFNYGAYSEIIYDKDTSLLNIVDPSTIIKKNIVEILNAGYFDQYDKENMIQVYKDRDCIFVYDDDEESYCMLVYFTEEEYESFSEGFKNILMKKDVIVNYGSNVEGFDNFISFEDLDKAERHPECEIKSFWMYSLKFSKEQLENMK